MSAPAVSVVMSVRDAQDRLPLALASLSAQTFSDWELLVLDDGSRDGSLTVVREAALRDGRIRVLDGAAPAGLAANLNQLVGAAEAPLIARMDADDLSYPLRLQRQVEFLRAHPEVDLLGTSMVVFGAGGRPLARRVAPPRHEQICRRPTRGFPLFHPTWAGRASWFRENPYTAGAMRCEDQELLFRTSRGSTFANLPEPLLGYREDRLVLRNLLQGRRHMATAFAGRLWRDRHPALAAGVVTEQLLKGVLDTVAITAGLGRHLPRRSAPLAPPDVSNWQASWELVGAELARTSRGSRTTTAG